MILLILRNKFKLGAQGILASVQVKVILHTHRIYLLLYNLRWYIFDYTTIY